MYKCVYTRFSRGKTSWSITFRQLLSLDKEVGADNSSVIKTESLYSNNTLFSQFSLKYAGGWNIQPCTSQYFFYVLDLHLCAVAGTFSFALQKWLTLISFPPLSCLGQLWGHCVFKSLITQAIKSSVLWEIREKIVITCGDHSAGGPGHKSAGSNGRSSCWGFRSDVSFLIRCAVV